MESQVSRFIQLDEFQEPIKSSINSLEKINSIHNDLEIDIKNVDSNMNKFVALSKKAINDIKEINIMNDKKLEKMI
jgi:hypothetical protein